MRIIQSLYFLNDPVVHEQANLFARRIMDSSNDDAQRLSFAFLQALGRQPSDDEIKRASVFLDQTRTDASNNVNPNEANDAAWQAMVRVIFRLNEFVYVD